VSRPAWVGKRRDETEPGIVNALLAIGAKVERLDRPCDLLISFRGRIQLLEVSGITKYRKREAGQVAFLTAWEVPIVSTAEEALKVVTR